MTLFVNGERIPNDEIEQEMNRLRPHYMQHVAGGKPTAEQEQELREWSKENVVERVLLEQAGKADPEPVAAEEIEAVFQQMMTHYGGAEAFHERFHIPVEKDDEIRGDMEKRMRTERLMEKLTSHIPEPPEEELRRFYEEHRDHFCTPDMIRASHILKHVEPGQDGDAVLQEMKLVQAKLADNGDFAEICNRYSDCPDNAGDLGFFPRGQMVPAFEDVVFELGVGQVSEVFRTEFGYHIAKVTEKRAGAPVAFDEVREHVSEDILRGQRHASIEAFVDGLRSKSTIEERED